MGRLVCIEVEDFKSYKGKQTIGPFNEFTSVIGPNGSGKSNLMDAISFVLGVHSSHLRSQNLKDMIYRSEAMRTEEDDNNAGSSSRNRRAARTASVTAVYEDDNGRQVRFKRSINQSGHSDYSIDNKVVPYSDYNTALERRNILVKAKNFLVFQGDVELVASQDPKDLTRLIEQISGSWEFKDSYEEMKQKMEEAIENSGHAMNKKRQMASEIKQYEEQKAEAERFEKLIADRRSLVVQYLLWKLYHIDEKAKNLENQSHTKNSNRDDLQFEVEGLENSFRKAREDKALIHREKIKCELHIRKINRELDDQLPTSINYREKISQLEKKIKQTEQSIERVKRDGIEQEQVVASLDKEAQMVKYAEEEFNASVPKILSNGITLTSSQLADYEKRKQEVSMKAFEEQQMLQQYQRQYKTEKQILDDKKAKIDRLREDETSMSDNLRQANEEKAAFITNAENINEQLNVRQQELKQLEEERIRTHQRETELNELLQDTLNKLMEASVTQSESEKDTKFNESVSVLKQIYPGVHGKLADLCRPSQRKYDTAVATVLGRNMDAIVVDDEQTAADCIQYMREQHIGTATFLPINSLSVPPIVDRYRNIARGARMAYDVIKFDKQYETVIQYATGSTLICDNLNIAKQICFEMNENVRAVTLNGAVIHQNGLMTGGQSSTQTTKRWQQSEIQELTLARDKYLAELNHISRNKRLGSAEDSARNDCFNLSNQLQFFKDELTTLDKRIQGYESSLEDIRKKSSGSYRPYEESKTALEELDNKIKKVEAQIAQVEDYVFEDFCMQINVANIREYEAMQYGVSDEVTERRAQFAAQKSRLETQLAFEQDQLGELIERLRKLESMLKNDTTAKVKLENDLAGMAGKTETLNNQLVTYQNELQKQIQLEESKQTEINEIARALEAKGKDVDEILRECRAVESEIDKIRAERVAIFRKCKLEGIELPLSRGTMDDIIIEDTRTSGAPSLGADTDMTDSTSVSEASSVAGDSVSGEDSSSMDLDGPSQLSIHSTDWEVEVDYSQVGEVQRNNDTPAMDREFQDEIKKYTNEIEQMAPNMKAIDRLEGVTERMRVVEQEFNSARQTAKRAREQFNAIKQQRYSKFYDAFSHISEKIDTVYKDLTKSTPHPMGGTAYLTAEDTDEPYLQGIKYHAMPPMKRFRDMEQLSGGEKSVAALALLFAIHSYQPSPFFVLDEVDAALDNNNVATVANYIRANANAAFQFIVISLKHTLYEKAKSLVGIYRDQEVNSSKTMTLNLDQYSDASNGSSIM
ncbi:RecF/RecN/SMC [Mycotypha africana]|uniref:RecF/RecN/SMC n=1 Tax=Mycotypha africana TaxID=64632 RepID=UPI002301E041|nr:RecF/RecN/SMC [Mycotypha africana]KAI8977063.1 RecF/RecN/SMC [Mycotypha africana]